MTILNATFRRCLMMDQVSTKSAQQCKEALPTPWAPHSQAPMEPHRHQMALLLQVKAGLHAPLPSLLVCFCCDTNQPYYNTHTRVTSWPLENPRTLHYLIYCEADEIENSIFFFTGDIISSAYWHHVSSMLIVIVFSVSQLISFRGGKLGNGCWSVILICLWQFWWYRWGRQCMHLLAPSINYNN